MATVQSLLTAEEFRRTPDVQRYELARGELVEVAGPMVWQGFVCENVTVLLGFE